HRTESGQAVKDIEHPVLPARQEAGKGSPVAVGEMTEGAGHRLLDDHLAELAHEQEGDEPADGVTQQHRWAVAAHDARRAEEQAGTYGAAQGEQLDVEAGQAACVLDLFSGCSHGKGSVAAGSGQKTANCTWIGPLPQAASQLMARSFPRPRLRRRAPTAGGSSH